MMIKSHPFHKFEKFMSFDSYKDERQMLRLALIHPVIFPSYFFCPLILFVSIGIVHSTSTIWMV